MQKIQFGTNQKNIDNQDKKQASFVLFFLRNYFPWKNNPEYSEEIQNTSTSVVLILNRWDGRDGFVGGFVESGEDILEATYREYIEEINLDTNIYLKENFKPLCSYSFNITTHAFSYELFSIEDMKILASNILNSKHYLDEITGFNLAFISDLGNKKGLAQIYKRNFSSSCLEQLQELILREELE